MFFSVLFCFSPAYALHAAVGHAVLLSFSMSDLSDIKARQVSSTEAAMFVLSMVVLSDSREGSVPPSPTHTGPRTKTIPTDTHSPFPRLRPPAPRRGGPGVGGRAREERGEGERRGAVFPKG